MMMAVSFERYGRLYYLDPGDTTPSIGDKVLVPTDSGPEVAQCVWAPQWISDDIGGLPGGPIDRRHHEPAEWGKLVVALNAVLSRRRWRTVHESRRAIEELGDNYNRLAYFERTAQALANLMYEKGALHRDEVSARMDAIRKRLSK